MQKPRTIAWICPGLWYAQLDLEVRISWVIQVVRHGGIPEESPGNDGGSVVTKCGCGSLDGPCTLTL